MKIKIEHASNPLNYGTNMMVINFMHYFDKISNRKNIYLLDVNNDRDLKYYINLQNKENVFRQTIDYNFINHKNIINKVINKIKRDFLFEYFNKKNIEKLIDSCDTLVVLGGDDLSEYYGLNNLNREFKRLKNIKNKKNIYLIGQTIGPFYNERIDLAKECLDGISIYSRDPWTTKYLNENLNISNIFQSSDLAFLDLPNQDVENIKINILKKYKIKNDEYIVIIPSGLYESYCDDKDIYIKNWCEIIKFIKNRIPNKKIVLLPHVLQPQHIDDRNIIKSLEKEFGTDKDIIYIYDEMSPLEARFILGQSTFSITGRMHGAISTLQMKKPTISIAYSVKYKGVIGEGLDLNELIVNGEKKEAWINFEVEKNTKNIIEYVLENYDELIRKIDVNVDKCKENVICMLENINKKINEGGTNE